MLGDKREKPEWVRNSDSSCFFAHTMSYLNGTSHAEAFDLEYFSSTKGKELTEDEHSLKRSTWGRRLIRLLR